MAKGDVLRAPKEMGVFPFEEEEACPGLIAEAHVSSRVRTRGPSGPETFLGADSWPWGAGPSPFSVQAQGWAGLDGTPAACPGV